MLRILPSFLVYIVFFLFGLLCKANPSPAALIGSTTLDRPVLEKERVVDKDTDSDEGGGDGDGGTGRGGGRGGGGGGGDDDDDDNNDNGLAANRAEVKSLFAHLADDSQNAYHYFIIDEFIDYNHQTASFASWRTRQSLCVVGPGQQITVGSVSLTGANSLFGSLSSSHLHQKSSEHI